MLVGFHMEGWDHLIVRGYLAKLLDVREDDLHADWVEAPGRGWQFVLDEIPSVLRRFYGKCAHFVVIGVDNDGNSDLMTTGLTEDPRHPRHWLHSDSGESVANCRRCQIHARIEATRRDLNWLPKKPGLQWPVLIAVPVEMIEAWLLTTQAMLEKGHGSLHAENELRHGQKKRLYGKPEPTKSDVEGVALPLIRSMSPTQLNKLREHSRSFADFARQVDAHRNAILGVADCW
jgi:hypothetical protein